LNAASTFSPLQPLQDTDVAGYLRHAHEQNLISTIEEGRRETQEDFYRMLEDRTRRDWEAKKKRVFEELGSRAGGSNKAISELKKSTYGKSSVSVVCRAMHIAFGIWLTSGQASTPSISLQMQSKMMTYDRVVTELNEARLRGVSYPIVNALQNAALSLGADVSFSRECTVDMV